MSKFVNDDSFNRDVSSHKGDSPLLDVDLLLFTNGDHGYKDMLDAIIEICDYEPVQAEQCAYLAFNKGYCQIKHGKSFRLKKMKKEFERKGLCVQLI
jgi:ATP-dependent Clp protease adaptor protein ClpS